MRTIVQIVPDLGPGSGVAAVAHHLEREFARRGFRTERVTMKEAHGSWLPTPGPGVRGKAMLALRVAWFSTVGTVTARRVLRSEPDAVSLCHNDALAGDVYVNHGVVRAAMRARGHATWRMVRNPLHAFTWVRDAARFGTDVHRVVVNLTDTEERVLRETYPRAPTRMVTIGNGVDTTSLQPATPALRQAARALFAVPDDAFVALFVGHEFERKGLPLVLEALAGTPESLHLLVVGGTSEMVQGARNQARSLGVERRVHLVGRLADPGPAFHSADTLVFPSAYEAYPLVVLEALAHGVPVIATAVGSVPDLITDGVTGFVVEPDPTAVRDRLMRMSTAPRGAYSAAARAVAEGRDWSVVAEQYLNLLEQVGDAVPGFPAVRLTR